MRHPSRSIVAPVAPVTIATIVALLSPAPTRADPVFVESGWTALWTLPVTPTQAVAVHQSPIDGSVLYGFYSGTGDVYRRFPDGRLSLVADTLNAVSGAITLADGSTFYVLINSGNIYKVPSPGAAPVLWIAQQHAGEDDPVALEVVPPDYTGPLVSPGELIVTDVGVNENNVEVLTAFDPATPESHRIIVPDDGSMGDPTDIAVTPAAIYVSDASLRRIWRVAAEGTVVAQTITPALTANPVAIDFDPRSGGLVVALDATALDGDSIVLLTPDAAAESWTATTIVTGLELHFTATAGNYAYQSVDVNDAGDRIVIAEKDKIHLFAQCDATGDPSVADCDADGRNDACQIALDGLTDCDANLRIDACEGELDPDADCDGDDIPDACPTCDLVDLVVVMDTSASMDDDAAVLCGRLDELKGALAHRGLSVNAKFYGISANPGGVYSCLEGNVIATFGTTVPDDPPVGLETLGACPGGNEVASEDWGRATAVVAEEFPWTPGAVRLIVPVADEGPWCGDPVLDPGNDRDSVLHAALVARARDVYVSPVVASGALAGVATLAQVLADETDGLAVASAGASGLVDDVMRIVRRACFGDRDCNRNEVPDACDIDDDTSLDCNADRVPDECELDDCNANGVPDDCDLSTGTSLDCDVDQRPDECPQCPPVDALFIMDTSASMDDEATALCTTLGSLDFELTKRGITFTTTLLGISATPGGAYSCLEGHVIGRYGTVVPDAPLGLETLGQCPGGIEIASEDWGRAIAVAAANHPWAEGAVRLIVPIADEGPWCGDPVVDPGNDREALEHAITIARREGVIVSPIVPLTTTAPVVAMLDELAAGTGGDAQPLSAGTTVLAAAIASLATACDSDWDCDGDDVPDTCELTAGTGFDCDTNGVLDHCDLTRGATDCDEDDALDACEIAADPALDCDGDGALDACQLAADPRLDCNDNGAVDACDIAGGDSGDANDDLVPDECQFDDCDGNGLDDRLEIAQGAADCNANLRLDACDVEGPGARDGTWLVKTYGTQAAPGVDRDGDDNGVAGLPGYDGRAATDPYGRLAGNGDHGSPLDGDYRIDYYATGLTVAITELVNDSNSTEPANEWVELFNYGPAPVELAGWALRDPNVSPDAAIPTLTIPSGGYVILAYDAPVFLSNWQLPSADHLNVDVFDVNPGNNLENVTDDVAIVGGGSVVWQLGWGDDDTPGVATHLLPRTIVVPASGDCDDNGVPDECQVDCDDNGVADACDVLAGASDCNTDGVPDVCQLDCDGNDVPDDCDLASGTHDDCDDNDVPDVCDLAAGADDCDADEVPDVCQPDCDLSGTADVCDIELGEADCDADGVPDVCQLAGADCDEDAVLDECQPDCDTSGVADVCEILDGDLGDCDGDEVPDVCEIADGAADCDGNDVPDACDLEDGAPDCNTNSVPDACDITAGAPDCNTNGKPDTCDLAAGSPDCNTNGVPDVCELTGNDCNSNSIPDACDITAGAPDCNTNGKPDSCDLAAGAPDCNTNSVPDACELTSNDCNSNSIPDACDITAGAPDCNANGKPDTCDLAAGAPDCNTNSVPDVCELT
ncbi:MAG: lamin tail domain-containing protein, partial [Deltaproteobacteria bacterium]|nr:lamin tail domain-containing protein [Deltaproteobacteria bacterium]